MSAPTSPLAKFGDHRDRALAARAGRGDERAFAELYDHYAPGLLAFSIQYVGDRAAAEDVVQQTFLSAYRVLTGGTELEYPRAWLYHVARNNCLTAIRDRGPAAVDAELAAELQDRAAAVPAQVERREALQAVVRDIVALPADQRAALALYELGDLSQAEIANTLGCKPARVKALVFQARSSLLTQRDARDASCESVREKLATIHGGALNHRLIRNHLRGCEACTAYRDELRDQRRRLALILPVIPLAGLREAVLGIAGGGAAAAKGGAGTSALLRPGRARWLATSTTAAVAVSGITLAAWPSGENGRRAPAPAAAARPAPHAAPAAPVRSAPVAHRKPARVHRRVAHPSAQLPHVRVVRTAATVPGPPPAVPHRSRPPRVPAVKPRPAPKPKPPPKPAPVVQPAPAPATTVAAAPPVVPAPAACADHSHASAQGLAHGKGHGKCNGR